MLYSKVIAKFATPSQGFFQHNVALNTNYSCVFHKYSLTTFPASRFFIYYSNPLTFQHHKMHFQLNSFTALKLSPQFFSTNHKYIDPWRSFHLYLRNTQVTFSRRLSSISSSGTVPQVLFQSELSFLPFLSGLRREHKVIKKDIKKIFTRTLMRSVAGAATSLIPRQTSMVPLISTRQMSCVHSGRLKKGLFLKVKHTDTTGYHKVVVKTSCNEPRCEDVNCADPQDITAKCPGRSAVQNQTSIPQSSSHTGHNTKIVGNLTSTIPPGIPREILDASVNASGQPKAQAMAIEPSSSQATVPSPSSNFQVDSKSTSFVQSHHDDVQQALTKHP